MLEMKWAILGLWIMLLAVPAAQAQTKQAPARSAKPNASTTTEEVSDERAGSNEAAPDQDAGQAKPKADSVGGHSDDATADDLGDPPPARPKTEKARPSPLTPRRNEFPAGKAKPPSPEYDELLSDIAALRSRVAALTTTLFKSKLRVAVEADGDHDKITDLIVTLDDGVIFSAPARFIADDATTVYDHAVTPGHHVVGIEVEREDARGKQYRIWQSSKFSVLVPNRDLLEVSIALKDDSDMAEDFPDDGDGEYDTRVRLRARVVEQ